MMQQGSLVMDTLEMVCGLLDFQISNGYMQLLVVKWNICFTFALVLVFE